MAFYLGLADRASDGSWGIVFPDLPGCTSAGTSRDDLFIRSIEAVRLWAEDAIADGETLPKPRDFDALMADSEVAGAVTAAGTKSYWFQVPLMLDSGRSVRANISVDAVMLGTIDDAAKQRGLTRSAFLVSAARDKIGKGMEEA